MNSEAMNNHALKRGSKATPFSTFLLAAVSGDLDTAETQLTDDVEWDIMPYNLKLKGKKQIIPWLKAGGASQKEPVFMSNLATKELGGL